MAAGGAERGGPSIALEPGGRGGTAFSPGVGDDTLASCRLAHRLLEAVLARYWFHGSGGRPWHPYSFRSTHGYSFAAVIGDECPVWRTDDGSATPDAEVLSALRPGLAGIPGSPLLCISSPYARRGASWQAFRELHGRDEDPVLGGANDASGATGLVTEEPRAAS